MWNPILLITRRKLNGLGEHYGVRLADGTVAHYTAQRGLEITSVEEFAQGKDIQILRQLHTSMTWQVWYRLNQIISNPRPYHATKWNCEIFANWLIGETPVSQQATGWALLASLAGLLALATYSQ